METALQLVRESLSTLPRQHTPRAMVLEMWSPAPQPQLHLGACAKFKFPGSASDLMNHEPLQRGPEVCALASPPGNSDAP